MAEIIDRLKSSSHPLAPGRIYSGLIKMVDSQGVVTVYIQELASSYQKVVPLNTNDNSIMAVGDVVKCTFTNEFFTELVVLGLANIKEVPTTPIFTYKVGDTGPGGGIIFFVDRYDEYTGFTYLEVAPVGTEVQRTWATNVNSNQTTAVSGADSKALGGGYQNTLDIVAQSGNVAATCAAAYCADLVSGGQSDWYLPSLAEIKMIYDVVHLGLGVGDFGAQFNYWSSSEHNAYYGWAQVFNFGYQYTNSKVGTYYVRPVRRF